MTPHEASSLGAVDETYDAVRSQHQGTSEFGHLRALGTWVALDGQKQLVMGRRESMGTGLLLAPMQEPAQARAQLEQPRVFGRGRGSHVVIVSRCRITMSYHDVVSRCRITTSYHDLVIRPLRETRDILVSRRPDSLELQSRRRPAQRTSVGSKMGATAIGCAAIARARAPAITSIESVCMRTSSRCLLVQDDLPGRHLVGQRQGTNRGRRRRVRGVTPGGSAGAPRASRHARAPRQTRRLDELETIGVVE